MLQARSVDDDADIRASPVSVDRGEGWRKGAKGGGTSLEALGEKPFHKLRAFKGDQIGTTWISDESEPGPVFLVLCKS